jgi:hypothetical protein
MAKPLGPKSLLIREAIRNNPDLGNTDQAQPINGSDTAKKARAHGGQPQQCATKRPAARNCLYRPATP